MSSSLSSTRRIARLVAIGVRESEPEGAAFTRFRFEAGVTAHAGNSFLNDGKSDTRAGVAFFGIHPAENLENAIVVLGRNANAVVGDGNTYVAGLEFASEPDVGNG